LRCHCMIRNRNMGNLKLSNFNGRAIKFVQNYNKLFLTADRYTIMHFINEQILTWVANIMRYTVAFFGDVTLSIHTKNHTACLFTWNSHCWKHNQKNTSNWLTVSSKCLKAEAMPRASSRQNAPLGLASTLWYLGIMVLPPPCLDVMTSAYYLLLCLVSSHWHLVVSYFIILLFITFTRTISYTCVLDF